METNVYALFVLLLFCTQGWASTSLDNVEHVEKFDGDLKQNSDHEKRQDTLAIEEELDSLVPDQRFRHIGLGKRTLDFFRFHSKIGKRLDLLALIQNNLDKSKNILSGKWRRPFTFGSKVEQVQTPVEENEDGSPREIRGRGKVDPYMYLIGVGK